VQTAAAVPPAWPLPESQPGEIISIMIMAALKFVPYVVTFEG
jgi:hypothetical protein